MQLEQEMRVVTRCVLHNTQTLSYIMLYKEKVTLKCVMCLQNIKFETNPKIKLINLTNILNNGDILSEIYCQQQINKFQDLKQEFQQIYDGILNNISLLTNMRDIIQDNIQKLQEQLKHITSSMHVADNMYKNLYNQQDLSEKLLPLTIEHDDIGNAELIYNVEQTLKPLCKYLLHSNEYYDQGIAQILKYKNNLLLDIKQIYSTIQCKLNQQQNMIKTDCNQLNQFILCSYPTNILESQFISQIIQKIENQKKFKIKQLILIKQYYENPNLKELQLYLQDKEEILIAFCSKQKIENSDQTRSYIFGAYTPCYLDYQQTQYVIDYSLQSFLFSQNSNEFYQLFNHKYALKLDPSYLLQMGKGPDLFISLDNSSNYSRIHQSYGFKDIQKKKVNYNEQIFGSLQNTNINCVELYCIEYY